MPDAARELWITGIGIASCLGEGADELTPAGLLFLRFGKLRPVVRLRPFDMGAFLGVGGHRHPGELADGVDEVGQQVVGHRPRRRMVAFGPVAHRQMGERGSDASKRRGLVHDVDVVGPQER